MRSRHRGRELAVQMLYQWEVGRVPVEDVPAAVLAQVSDGDDIDSAVRTFAADLVTGTVEHLCQLDATIAEVADNWRLERINTVDRLVLRMAIYEVLYEPATPARVIINEALELARSFSGDPSVRFVNGILDAVCRREERT